MRIGVVHPKFAAIGGAEVLIGRYALHLRQLGHDVRLVTTTFDATRWPELASQLDVRVVGASWTDVISLRPMATKHARRAERLAASLDGLDVVLAGNYPAAIAAVRAHNVARTLWWCMEPNRRLHNRENFRTLAARVDASPRDADNALLAHGRVMLAREDAARRHATTIAERSADIAAVRGVDRVIAISEYSAESVHCAYGRSADLVLYPTVPDVDAPRRAPGVDRAGLRVLAHTRLERLKNVDTVLAAFALFRTRHPGAHELHVVGRGPDEQRLRECARSLGLGESARFHGFLAAEALEQIYVRCEMMALLPADEPCGMVYPEAAQRGLLLAGSDHGGPLEILEGGELGWALDIFSAEPLAEAFAEAWRLPVDEVERRRVRAAASCRARFGPTATLPRVVAEVVG